ncbi:CRIB domain-containing protein RIC7, partial [Mucuna pruriens]
MKKRCDVAENEKEQDIQIGYPTDVKHVAHIGWDGPSMNEYKASPQFASPPIVTADVQKNKGQENSVKWVSEVDAKRRSTRDLPDLPKASKRQSTGGVTDSPTREKPNRHRQPRKASNKAKDESIPTRISEYPDSPTVPDIPKKSRRQRSKESSSGGSAKSTPKSQPNSDTESPTHSDSSSFQENHEQDNIHIHPLLYYLPVTHM